MRTILFKDRYESLLFILALPVITSELAWVLHIPFFLLLAIAALGCIVATVWARKSQTKSPEKRATTGKTKVILLSMLLLGVISMAPYASAIIRNPDAQGLLGLQIYGFDDEAHFSLVKNIASHNKLAYESFDSHPSDIEYSLAGYPQGWHAISSVIYTILLKAFTIFNVSFPTNELLAYTVAKLGWYLLLSLVTYLVIFEIAQFFIEKFTKKSEYVFSSLAAVFMTALLQAITLFEISADGFESYVGNLVFIALLMILVVRSLGTKPSPRLFFYILLCTLGITSTWFINIIVSLAVLYVLFVQTQPGNTVIGVIRQCLSRALNPTYLKSTIGYGLLFIAILAPCFAEFTLGTSSDLLNTPGGISPVNTTFIVWLAVLCLIGLAAFRKRAIALLGLWSALLSPIIVWLFVWSYEGLTVGTLSYYYQKTGYTVLYCLFILFSALVVALPLRFRHTYKIQLGTILFPSLLLGILLLMLLPVNVALFREYASGSHAMNKFTNAADREKLLSILKNDQDIIVVSYYQNNDQDKNFNHFLNALADQKNQYREVLSAIPTNENSKHFAQAFAKYVASVAPRKVYVLGTTNSYNDLTQNLPKNVAADTAIVK